MGGAADALTSMVGGSPFAGPAVPGTTPSAGQPGGAGLGFFGGLSKEMQPINTALQDISGPAAIASGIGATAMGNPTAGLPLVAGGIQSTASPGSPSTMSPALISQMMGGQQKPQQQPQYAPRPPVTPQNMGQQMAAPKPNPAPPVPQGQWPPTSITPQQRAMILQALGGTQ